MTVDDPGGRPGRDTAAARPRDRPRSRASQSDLERYAGLFAERTRNMRSSAMRDLMALTQRPEVISLAGGLPDTTLFPAEELAKHLSVVAAEAGARALQYAPTEGLSEVKRAIREVLRAEGDDADPEDVLVTTGGQQVIDLVCKTLVNPGDVVVAEAPTYPGAVPAFAAYEADVVQIAMDADGLRVDALEERLDALGAEGRSPKFIYTIPNVQNPAGVTLSLPRRRRLVEVARERELLILEDNPYGLLRFEGAPLPTLRSLDGGEFVISLGTFSKILSPGLRLGWAVAPRPVLSKMNIGKAASDLNSSSLTQLFVATFFRDGDWRGYVAKQCALYRARRDVMLASLEEHFPPGATWTRPEGGLFLWVTLPDGLDTTDLLAKALSRNVAFVPGRAAYLDGRGGASLRLNFSGVGEDDIREGVRRIGAVVHEQIELLDRLTGRRPAAPAPAEALAPAPDPTLADVLELRRRAPDPRRPQRGSSSP